MKLSTQKQEVREYLNQKQKCIGSNYRVSRKNKNYRKPTKSWYQIRVLQIIQKCSERVKFLQSNGITNNHRTIHKRNRTKDNALGRLYKFSCIFSGDENQVVNLIQLPSPQITNELKLRLALKILKWRISKAGNLFNVSLNA